MSETLVARLQAVLGARYVLTARADVEPYATDWRGRYRGMPLCVARPGNTAEVAAAVKLCVDEGIAVVPQGGNTGLCGGATPRGGEVVINLGRLNDILALDCDNNTITVGAGCTLLQVQKAAEEADRLFPLSLAAEGTATIGGNLSTNAGGVQVLRYGNARDLVLGLEVVLPDGRAWNGLRGLRKDNTGYDLKQLFIGAEGTLGLITAAVLKLFPLPRVRATAWVAVFSLENAIALLSSLRTSLGDCVTAFEIVGPQALNLVLRHMAGSRDPLAQTAGWKVLLELSDCRVVDLEALLTQALAEAGEANLILDAAVARSESDATSFWALREHVSEAQRLEGISIKHDIAVPVSRIPEFVARADGAIRKAFPGVRIVCFGHIGDGNLHYNVSKPTEQDNTEFLACSDAVNRVVHDLVDELGGTISAEHGLGQLKRDEIKRYKSELEIETMRTIKRALDPRDLMNPGKVV